MVEVRGPGNDIWLGARFGAATAERAMAVLAHHGR